MSRANDIIRDLVANCPPEVMPASEADITKEFAEEISQHDDGLIGDDELTEAICSAMDRGLVPGQKARD